MTNNANQGLSTTGVTRKPTIHDAVFPVLPFAGVLAVAQEQAWTDKTLFPSFDASRSAVLPYCSYLEARDGLQRALRRYHSLELALLSGARKALPHLGVMSLGMTSQATLGKAFEFGTRYQLVAGSMLQLRVGQERDEAWIEAQELFDDPEMTPFLAIDHLATALNSVRQILWPSSGQLLKRVELSFDAPSLRSGLSDLFGAPILFGSTFNRIVFDRQAFDQPLYFYNDASIEISRQACERELAARGLDLASPGQLSLQERLYDDAGVLLPLPSVAAAMGLSPRSLHRLMAREGIRYSELYEQEGRRRAEQMLQRGLSTSAVAQSLQFSDQRSFVRAFERWTGMSPAVWRRQQAIEAAGAVDTAGQAAQTAPGAV